MPNTQTPSGVKDFLPAEVAARGHVIEKIKQIFEAHHYQRIVTPSLELYETLKQGLSPDLKNRCIKFIDRDGHLMVLRPDMTTPIARVVASKLPRVSDPLRLYYIETVFRKQKPEAGRELEFVQIGVELIGVKGEAADTEILTIARESLAAIGLNNVEIDVGHVDHFKSLSEEKRQSLLKGDYVRYGSLPDRDNLVVNDFDYYTGMVFECYVPELGYLLGGGGRYDKLIGKFGSEKPAVGFALSLEMLLQAMKVQKETTC